MRWSSPRRFPRLAGTNRLPVWAANRRRSLVLLRSLRGRQRRDPRLAHALGVLTLPQQGQDTKRGDLPALGRAAERGALKAARDLIGPLRVDWMVEAVPRAILDGARLPPAPPPTRSGKMRRWRLGRGL